MGNLRQWIISGVGGEADMRDRDREFRIEEKFPKATLQSEFNAVLDQVFEVCSSLRAPHLLEIKRIQGVDVSVLGAIYKTMTHLELHAGQISLITRMRIGQPYNEFWKPANKEQGA
jgi:hypothetical protein